MRDPLAEIQSPMLRQLYGYWEQLRGDRAFPARTELDPLAFRTALGNVLLVDVTYEPLTFRYRLIGSNIVERVGYNSTGKTVDDIPEPGRREAIRTHYMDVLGTRRPVVLQIDRLLDGRLWRFDYMVLPLSADGKQIDCLMVGASFERKPEDSSNPVIG